MIMFSLLTRENIFTIWLFLLPFSCSLERNDCPTLIRALLESRMPSCYSCSREAGIATWGGGQMGDLVQGKWRAEGDFPHDRTGRFVRPDAPFRNWVTADGSAGPGRTGLSSSAG